MHPAVLPGTRSKKNARSTELKTLIIFQSYREQMARESTSAFLFAQPPVLPFRPTQTDCPICHAPLQVYKTQRKTLRTLHLGCFTAHETLLHCEGCQNIRDDIRAVAVHQGVAGVLQT